MKRNHKKESKSIKLVDLVPYCKVPIKVGDVKLGTVKIDFHFNKRLTNKNIKHNELPIKALWGELGYLGQFFKQDFELSRRLYERVGEKIDNLFLLLHAFCPNFKARGSFIPIYFHLKDDDIFNLIKTFGPSALRLPMVQYMFISWLSFRNANEKISMLEKALLEYSYGPAFKNKRFKEGRRPNSLLKCLGNDWINDIHKNLSKIFRIIKKNKIISIEGSVREFIESGFKQYASSLEKDLEKKGGGNEKETKKINRLKEGIEMLENPRSSNLISTCIENDPYLKDYFIHAKWEPNKFAKEILAKLFDVSVSTIDSVLYR